VVVAGAVAAVGGAANAVVDVVPPLEEGRSQEGGCVSASTSVPNRPLERFPVRHRHRDQRRRHH